jgi:class 3 adenylate cyclase
MGRPLPGMEIHAHAIATLLQGGFVSEVGFSRDLLALSFFTALAWLAAARISLRHARKAAAFLLLGYFIINTWMFVDRGLDVALMVPLITMALMMAGMIAQRGESEEGARHRMTGVLDQYVSPQVAQAGAPQGEVTLVFTDIEGSSLLSERHGAAFEKVRDEHFLLLREKARLWNGFEVETAGDSLFIVFADAADAIRFAIEGQSALARHKWPLLLSGVSDENGASQVSPNTSLPVRIGMHTGTPFIGRDRSRLTYRGPATNRASRVMGAARGGQILISQLTWERACHILKQDPQFADLKFIELGRVSLKGVGEDMLWEVRPPDSFEPPARPRSGAVSSETS